MLKLQTPACSFVTFHCRRSGLPFALRQLKVLEIDAMPLQEMHSGSFALLSNRVNELKLPTICTSPKESATNARSVMDGRAGTRRCTEASAACGQAQGQTGLPTSAKCSYREDVLWFMLGVLSLHPYLQPEKTSLLFILMAPLKDSKEL